MMVAFEIRPDFVEVSLELEAGLPARAKEAGTSLPGSSDGEAKRASLRERWEKRREREPLPLLPAPTPGPTPTPPLPPPAPFPPAHLHAARLTNVDAYGYVTDTTPL